MSPKARVYAALNGDEIDRIPVWMWYHPAIYQSFNEIAGWDADTTDRMLGNDIKSVHVSINREMFRPLAEGEIFRDDWGVSWVRKGWYNQVVNNPLADEPVSAISSYQFPAIATRQNFAPLAALCERYAADYFIGVDISGTIFEPCYHIRGMEQLLIDMLEERASVEKFFDNAMNFSIGLCREALKYPIDWIWLGDDVGGQQAMMLRPELWRSILRQRMAHIIATIKRERPGIIIAYHSCGAIAPIIDDLIEIGVDVLNPIQPLCSEMSPLALAEKYGRRIAFMGGLDTQQFLIQATVEEVKSEVCLLAEKMTAHSAYILAASHTIQPDTPIANILAIASSVLGKNPLPEYSTNS